MIGPWGFFTGSAWVKPVAGLLLGVAILAAVGFGVAQVYQAGVSAEHDRMQVRVDAAEREAERLRTDYEARLKMAQAALQELEADGARRAADQAARAAAAERKTSEALNANPDFARTSRPLDLRRVRDDDFARLAEAAERGAVVSGRIAQGVPGTDPGKGLKPQ